MALASEMLVTRRFAGAPSKLASIDVRFTRPLVLPRRVQVFIGPDAHGPGEHGVAVGEASAGPRP